jgi:prepilin-type processing-associated H-X9-DG protein
MTANLAGYLLDALTPDERREVEAYLQANPEAHHQLELMRQAIEPLAADRDVEDPPAGLWVRTLARVAEYRCSTLPAAPVIPAARSPAPTRGRWRWIDLAVAAAIFLCIGLLIPPGISYLRYRHDIVACQNNLRAFYIPLREYSERHNGDFPNVAVAAPRDRAGMFIPILNQEGLLGNDVSVFCPSIGRSHPPDHRPLDEVERLDPAVFDRFAPTFAGFYAYSLGYHDDSGYHGVRLDPGQPNYQFQPILADRPPVGVDQGDPGNSPNHGGQGQNVLYIDGHCSFWTKRTVGVGADDIYLNYDNQVAAGKNWRDAVLASSGARP